MKKASPTGRFLVEYSNVHLYESPRERHVTQARHLAAELIVVLSGGYEATWQLGGRHGEVRAVAGDVVNWPGGTQRTEANTAKPPLRALAVYFVWRDALPDLPVIVHDRRGVIGALAHSLMLAKDMMPLACHESVMNGYLAALLAEYLRLAKPGASPLAELVARYVESHLREDIYLEDLARMAGLEKSYFCRRYHAETGQRPMEGVLQIRAEHAAGSVRANPALPLKDIAARVGVHDEHQLSKLLKKYLGVTAREILGK